MTETTNKRKNADDLPVAKKTIKRMCIKSNQNNSNSPSEAQSSEERICSIFQHEVDTEIASKIKDLEVVQERLKECHRDLDLLRKAVVSSYYEPTYKKSTKLEQHRIHPAVQKLIGKRPISCSSVQEEVFEHGTRPLTRHMRKEESAYQKTLKSEKNIQTTNKVQNNLNIEDKIPRYIPPNMFIKGETRLPRGNKQKKQIRFLIGNVSKRVNDGSHDKATHKWMLYVRSMGSFNIGKDVSKVRFFLHPSYKPHDVVTISKAPFTLTRRGWGEFPIRVQLHFHNPLNKTVDILHHLKLHGVSSGPHSRSAETLADVWLYCDDAVDTNRPTSNCETSENSDDLTDSGFVQNSSSPSYSSEISDSNVNNCDTSGLEKTFNLLFSVNDADLFNTSECSNISEISQGFNLSLLSDNSFVSNNNNNSVDNLQSGTAYSKETKINSTVDSSASYEVNSEHRNSDLSFDDACQMLLDNLNTNTSYAKYKTFNNISPIVESCSFNSSNITNVVNKGDGSDKQSTCLEDGQELFATDHVPCSRSNLLKDLDDFSDVLNIENIILNNTDLPNNESISFIRNVECPLPLSESDSGVVGEIVTVSPVKELESHVKYENSIGSISKFDNSQNNSKCGGLEHKVDINSRPKTPDKNVEDSFKKIMSSVISEKDLKSEKIDSPSKVGFCEKTENILDSDEKLSISRVVTNNNAEISNIEKLENDTKFNVKSPDSNNPAYVDYKFSESTKFENIELKVKPELHENGIKIEAACDQTVVKEEIIEIEDYCSNWMDEMEEVIIDVNSEVVDNYCTDQTSVVMQKNCKEIIIKAEPLSPKQDNSTALFSEEQIGLRYGYQDMSISAENQLDGLTSSFEDFLKSTAECHLGPTDSSEDRFGLSSDITENINILENIDEKLSSLAEILPDHETSLNSDPNGDLDSKKTLANKLDDPILELPSLDCFPDYLSNSVKTFEFDFGSTSNISLVVNDNITDNLTETQLDTLQKLQDKDLADMKLRTSTVISTDKIHNRTNSVLESNNSECSQSVSNPETVFSTNNMCSTVLSTSKPMEVKPLELGNSNTSSIVTTPKVVKVNSSGLIETYSLPSELGGSNTLSSIVTIPKFKLSSAGLIETCSLPTKSTHKGSKNVKVLLKNKDGIISSTSDTLQKGSFILKVGKPVTLPANIKKKELVRVSNKCQTILPARASLMKKGDDDSVKCIYIPPKGALTNFSVNGSKRTSILRTVPGVSLLKKNLVVTNGNSSVIKNSLSVPSLVSSVSPQNQMQRVKTYSLKTYPVPKSQILSTNGTIEKRKLQLSTFGGTNLKEDELKQTSSSRASQLCRRITQVPIFLKKLSPTHQITKEKKIMVLNKSESRKINFDGRITQLQNSLERLVTDCKFTDMDSAVRWLVRGLPLITPEANQWIYKVIHPYSAASFAIFQSWPAPKQFASEWLRAKTVCRLLERTSVDQVWTTKQVLYWARYHGYSPLFNLSSGLETKGSTINMNVNLKQQNIFTPPENIIKWIENCSEQKVKTEELELIDVEGEVNIVQEKEITQEELVDENGIVACGPEWKKDVGSYVREILNKLGYRLGREELVPGELHEGAALTVLTHTMMTFAEDLVRRSLAASYHRKTSVVELTDTYSAIFSRQEFDIFTNIGLGSSQINSNHQ